MKSTRDPGSPLLPPPAGWQPGPGPPVVRPPRRAGTRARPPPPGPRPPTPPAGPRTTGRTRCGSRATALAVTATPRCTSTETGDRAHQRRLVTALVLLPYEGA